MARKNLEVHLFRNAAELVDAINFCLTRKAQLTATVEGRNCNLDRITWYTETLSDGSEVCGFELGTTTASQWARENA